MNPQPVFDHVAAYLGPVYARMQTDIIWQEIVMQKTAVSARFQPLFNPAHLPRLTEAELRPLFSYEHNCHWTTLGRQVNRICGAMPDMRQALAVLADENRPIAERFDIAEKRVFGMGKAILTAILLVSHPDRYGVWNGTTEIALKEILGLWPVFKRGSSDGEKYLSVNALLLRLATALKIDLWTLDALFWQVLKEHRNAQGQAA